MTGFVDRSPIGPDGRRRRVLVAMSGGVGFSVVGGPFVQDGELVVGGGVRERAHRRGSAQPEHHLRGVLHRDADAARQPHAADARNRRLAEQLRRPSGQRRAQSLPVDLPGAPLA